jgi:7,8-dihydro-6-hydroxymethylpterin-pyrophosphokinase
MDHLRRAAAGLEKSLGTLSVSSVYQSKPIGYADQGDFLNAVALAWTRRPPEDPYSSGSTSSENRG